MDFRKKRKLNEKDKIKVVSVSASPSGYAFYKNQHLWIEAVEKVQAEGILVLDCRDDEKTEIIGPAYYDYKFLDDVT